MNKVKSEAPKSRWRRILDAFSGQLIYGVLTKSVRGPLLLFGGVLLLSTTSAWKFMESSFSAHDMVREAVWTKHVKSDVLVIGIDDTAYKTYFDSTSPLRRDRLQVLLQTIQESAPQVQKIVVDLDLTPPVDVNQIALMNFFGEQPKKWVIADPIRSDSDDSPQARAWREGLCQNGVLVGLPYLPTDFGYINPRYQFIDSLAQVAVSEKGICQKQSADIKKETTKDSIFTLSRFPASMSPAYANTGLVLPFHGNLDELATAVAAIKPKYIVFGGMWGTGDVLNTPFGDRYGVHLHGAAIDGALKGYKEIPYVFNFFVVWICVGLMTIILSVLKERLEALAGPNVNDLPGHQFLMQKLWPFVVLTFIFFALIILSEILAILFSLTGFQVKTSITAGSILGYVILVWNFGLGKISRQQNVKATWNNIFVKPIKADFSSLRSSLRRIFMKTAEVAATSTTHNNLSLSRAGVEAAMALLSLIFQTLLPMYIMGLAIYKSF